jgi:hypothetical protein
MRRFFVFHILCLLWIAALVGWPYYIWTLHQIPSLDKETVLLLGEYVDAEVERLYGPPLHEEYERLCDKITPLNTYDSRFPDALNWKSLSYPRLQLLSHLESIGIQFDPIIKEWDRLAAQGPCYEPFASVPFADRRDSSEYEGLVSFSSVFKRNLQTYRCALICKAIHDDNWDEVLRQLQSISRIADSMMFLNRPGHLLNRRLMYDIYYDILALNPPIEFEKQILALMAESRTTAPDRVKLYRQSQGVLMGEFMLAGEMETDDSLSLFKNPAIYTILCSNFPQQYIMHMQTMSCMESIVFGGVELNDAGLRQWMEHYRDIIPWDCSEMDVVSLMGHQNSWYCWYLLPQWGWSTTPAVVEFLRRAALSEPQINEFIKPSSDIAEKLDPWTLSMLRMSLGFARIIEDSGGALTVDMRLTELAYAARLFRHEQREWPGSINDLNPQYQPDLQYQMGWVEVNVPIIDQMWKNVFPLGSGLYPPTTGRHVDLSEQTREYNDTSPLEAFASVEQLRAHPNLVEYATPWMILAGQPESASAPLNPDYALQEHTFPELQRVFITYKAKAPQKAFAIWLPEECGVRSPYQYPITTRTMDGNIFTTKFIVFPEGY